MATVIKCDACDAVVKPREAMHVRIYPMDTATTFKSSDCKHAADICVSCEKKLKEFLNIGGKK